MRNIQICLCALLMLSVSSCRTYWYDGYGRFYFDKDGSRIYDYPRPVFTQPPEPNGLKEAREWCAAENKRRKRQRAFYDSLSDDELSAYQKIISLYEGLREYLENPQNRKTRKQRLTITLERLTAPERDLSPDIVQARNTFSKEKLEEYIAVVKEELNLEPMPELPNGYVVFDLYDLDWDPRIVTQERMDDFRAYNRDPVGYIQRKEAYLRHLQEVEDIEKERRAKRERINEEYERSLLEDRLKRLEQKEFERELEHRWD